MWRYLPVAGYSLPNLPILVPSQLCTFYRSKQKNLVISCFTRDNNFLRAAVAMVVMNHIYYNSLLDGSITSDCNMNSTMVKRVFISNLLDLFKYIAIFSHLMRVTVLFTDLIFNKTSFKIRSTLTSILTKNQARNLVNL